jgi:ATP-dependent Lhr-like helicase
LKYDPNHLLLKITRTEAMRGLVDFERLREMTRRIEGKIDHLRLKRVSPLAAPLFLEAGRVPIAGAGKERLLNDAADRLMATAGLTP